MQTLFYLGRPHSLRSLLITMLIL